MYVTVSLKIELDATASLSHMERQIGEAGRAAMKDALEQALHKHEEQQKRCPHCGSQQVQSQGTKRRVLLTSFGRVDMPLKRLRWKPCAQLFRPAERCLAEVQGSNVTAELRELAALVGSSWPSDPAAGVLKRLSGVQLSDERLRQLTNEQGSALAQQQQSEAQQVLQEAVSMTQIRAQRERSQQDDKQDQPEWLQVGLDGGWLPSREQAGGMEGKIGVVASQVEDVGKQGRHRLRKRRYVATFGSTEDVGKLTYMAACDLGAIEAKQQVVLGDGAHWIKTQAGEHFPDAVKILDWPHLWRTIRDAVRAVQPGKRLARRAWRPRAVRSVTPEARARRARTSPAASPELAIGECRTASRFAGGYPLSGDAKRLARQLRGLEGTGIPRWQWAGGTSCGHRHQCSYEETRHVLEAG